MEIPTITSHEENEAAIEKVVVWLDAHPDQPEMTPELRALCEAIEVFEQPIHDEILRFVRPATP
ncbi:MAG: hypothetical protein NVS3B25_32360 [Hymenobacter sp.]